MALEDVGKGADKDEWKVAALPEPTREETLHLQVGWFSPAGLRRLGVKGISTCYIPGPMSCVSLPLSDSFLSTPLLTQTSLMSKWQL